MNGVKCCIRNLQPSYQPLLSLTAIKHERVSFLGQLRPPPLPACPSCLPPIRICICTRICMEADL